MMVLALTFVLAALISYAANRFVVIPALTSHAVLDHPSARSSHERPVVRGGGIGVAVGYIVAASTGVVWQMTHHSTVGFGFFVALAAISAAVVCGAVGLADDFDSFSAIFRLGLQLVLGILFGTVVVMWSPWGWTVIFVVAASIVLVVNAINFMDGVNTLITGWGAIVGGWYTFVALRSEQSQLAVVAIALCGAALAFIPLNITPAKAFLGDVGSYAIGGIAIALFWLLWLGGASRLLIAAPFVVPLFDVLVTLVKRIYEKENIFQPHKKHYYQRLQQAGVKHEVVAAVFATAVLVCGAGALTGNKILAVIVWLVVCIGYAALPHVVYVVRKA